MHIKKKTEDRVVMCLVDANIFRFNYGNPIELAEFENQLAKSMAFSPKSLCHSQNAHTYTQISQIHTSLFHLQTDI